MTTSSLLVSRPSSPVSVRTYVPAADRLAVVLSAVASPNVTFPGPPFFVQTVVTGTPEAPSSVTVPASDTPAGSVTAVSGPALTMGGAFGALETGAPATHDHPVPLSVPLLPFPDESLHTPHPSLNPQRASRPVAVAISCPLPARICVAERG